mgnify:CR=1 FL=1
MEKRDREVHIDLRGNKNEIRVFNYGNLNFPGGNIEDNEDMIEAVHREFKEEVGIKLVD